MTEVSVQGRGLRVTPQAVATQNAKQIKRLSKTVEDLLSRVATLEKIVFKGRTDTVPPQNTV